MIPDSALVLYPTHNCTCLPAMVTKYQKRISGSLQQLGMSARSFHHVLKLARTIADLEGVEMIQAAHLAEALQYRPRRQA